MITAFYLSDSVGGNKSEGSVDPGGTDTSQDFLYNPKHSSVTSLTNSKGNPGQVKAENVYTNDFQKK